MRSLAQNRPALIAGIGEGNAGPSPPGAERVANLLEVVGIGIFLALLVGIAVTLIRRNRDS
ncbi:MAG: hypothetical protein ACJ8BC_03740 [Gemmatimonadales bacterium]|jgi:hypothetical protein